MWFNSQLNLIEDFSNSIKNDVWIKLSISEYINENEQFLNKDFFKKIENVNDEYIEWILENVSKKLIEFKKIKIKLKMDKSLSPEEKTFLLQILNNTWFELIRLQNSIYLEAEKAWYKLSKNDRKKYVKNIYLINFALNWKEFSTNQDEINAIFKHLFTLYNQNWDNLTTKEKNIFFDFCKNFWRKIPTKKDINKKNKQENNDLKDFLYNKIEIEKVKEIFEKVLKLYWLDWWKSEIWNFPNFWVNKKSKKIKIPKNIKSITIKKLLELIDHEIWVHAIRWYNQNKTLKVNYDHYVEAEEWFAKLSTSLFNNDLEDVEVEIWKSAVSTFIAENYDWENTYELLKIYYKLNIEEKLTPEEIELKAKDIMLRKKKFLSLKEKWALRKDVSYYRWEQKILNYLLEEDDIKSFIKKFYFSKLSLKDLEYVDYFKEKLDIDEDELIYPLWIWKIIYKKLLWKKVTLEKLRQWDPRFEAIDNISFWVKRKIIEILEIIQNNVIKKD